MPEVIPDLGLAVAALFLLLIAGALWVLTRILVGTLGKAPVIGGWVSRDIGGWLNDARNAVLKAAYSTWDGAIRLFDWASDYLWRMWEGAVNTFSNIATTVENIVDTQLPALLNTARSEWDAAVRSAEADATELFNTARKDIDAAAATVEHYALGLFDTARSDAIALVDDAIRALDAAIRAAETVAANDLAKASTMLAADIATAERDALNAVTRAEALAATNLAAVRAGIYTDLAEWGDQAVVRVWDDSAGDIAALRKTLGGDFPWLNDLLGALGGLGAAGLAGALIRSIAGAEAVTRLADECIVPNCRNLSGFGNELQDLIGAVTSAGFLAWLIFTIADPQAAATDTEDALSAVISGTVDAAKTLFGVS